MLYVIGGVPHSGKSKLAARLNRNFGYSVFTTDALIAAFMVAAPKANINFAYPRSKNKFASALTVVVRQLLRSNRHYVLEGEILTPSLIEPLWQYTKIRDVYLGLSDPDIDAVIKFETSDGGWVHRMSKNYQKSLSSALVARNEELEAECEEYGAQYFDMSDGSYRKQAKLAYEYLVGWGSL